MIKLLILTTSLLFSSIASSNHIKSQLESVRAKYGIPGLAAAYYKNGVLQAASAVGVRKVGEPAALEVEDKFHLGSCSKAMTATLAAIIIQKREDFSWNSPLGKLFPDLSLAEEFRDMPFERLLSHSAGVQANREGLREIFMANDLTPKEIRKKLAGRVLTRVPQKTPGLYSYSNTGYMIAGHILEKLTKKDYQTLMREEIFSKLNMKSCGFGPLNGSKDPVGHFYENEIYTPLVSDNPQAYDPAGRIHCSLEDWAKFLNEQIKAFNGESLLLSKHSLEKMHASSSIVYEDEEDHKKNIYYTAGGWTRLSRSWAGDYALTHNGTNRLNYARVWLSPSKGITLISTSNAAGETVIDKKKVFLADFATNEAVIAIKKFVDGE